MPRWLWRHSPRLSRGLINVAKALLVLQMAAFTALMALLLAMPDPAQAQAIPAGAARYQATLRREAQRAWGMDAPVATFAAQVHQESRWNPDAVSPVGAQGLGQFMPATSNWLGGLYTSLGDRAPRNPTWALRALVTYDQWLYQRVHHADDDCQRMAYALSAYNGGLGWVYKRQALSPQPGICLGATCQINPGISAAAQRENARYPELILLRYEPLYASWGPGVCP